MLRRYELTDQEWEQVATLLPLENPDDLQRITVPCLMGWSGLHAAEPPRRDLPERYGSWNSVYSRFRKWIDDGILDNIFRVLNLEAELYELSPDATIVQAHQHSAGAKKGGPPNEIGHRRGGASSKIHAAVDAYGYPVYLMLSEGQRNDINFAIPVLEHINIEGSNDPFQKRSQI